MLDDGTIGLLTAPAPGYRLENVKVWALDNGAFTGRYPGDDAYMALLERYADHRDRCLFVAVPDVVGEASATLALFPPMAARIRAEGWPVALVAQDGMTPGDIPWPDIDYLFVGGSTEWKLGADVERLIYTAHDNGTPVHIGRVNSRRRYTRFAAMGCASADGTFLAFGPDINLPKLLSWLTTPLQQPLDLWSKQHTEGESK